MSNDIQQKTQIAVLIPCYNEEATVANVVASFRKSLPFSTVYVFDNNSTDNSRKHAAEAGAIVIEEPSQGKGNVVRSMFQKISADIYLLVDGDATYPAEDATDLIKPVLNGTADMSVGNRMGSYHKENTRRFHSLGNRLVKWLVNTIFNAKLNDILSGYRVFSKAFVKTVPLLSPGFEVETELTLHALDKRMKIVELPIDYKNRPENSPSKLNTFSDGLKVLKTILFVFKNYRPLAFFSIISIFFSLSGLAFGLPTIIEYLNFQYVYKVPSAILAASLEILAALALCCGLILDTVARQHKELFELEFKKQYKPLNPLHAVKS